MGLAVKNEAPARLEAGHARGEVVSDALPRVPVIGIDSGCIPGTKPGQWMGQAAELDRVSNDLRIAGKELVRRKLAAARGRRAMRP